MKNVKFRGKKTNSAVKRRNSAVNSAAQIPRLKTQIPRNPRKTVGPSYESTIHLIMFNKMLVVAVERILVQQATSRIIASAARCVKRVKHYGQRCSRA